MNRKIVIAFVFFEKMSDVTVHYVFFDYLRQLMCGILLKRQNTFLCRVSQCTFYITSGHS